jgi:hypothetical protein
LQSVASYANGVTGSSPGITVTVSNAPPTTSVLIPSTGATISGTSAVLDASASAPAGVNTVQFVLTGGSYSQMVVATGTPTFYGWVAELDTTTIPNGTYTLQSLVTDDSSNTAYSAGITITVQN